MCGGQSTIAKDEDPGLNGHVIRALRHAMEPSLTNVRVGWNGTLEPINGVFRNQIVHSVKILDAKQFNQTFKFEFRSDGGDGYN